MTDKERSLKLTYHPDEILVLTDCFLMMKEGDEEVLADKTGFHSINEKEVAEWDIPIWDYLLEQLKEIDPMRYAKAVRARKVATK